MIRRPFSILLPEGGRLSSHRTLFGALSDALKCNRSRDARGLPLVRVLDRDTGTVHEVPPDADIMALDAAASVPS